MEMPDTRIPLSVEAPKLPTPFEMKGQALALEKGIREQKQGQEQQQDQDALKQYLAGGGNISTPEGLKKAQEDLKGQVSPDMTTQLTQAQQQMEQMSLNQKVQIAKLDDVKIKQMQDQYNFMDEAATNTYDVYTKTAAAKGSQAADTAFTQSKQEFIGRAQQMGFSPEMIKQYSEMNPAQMASLKSTALFKKKELEDALNMRVKAGQASELEARAQSEREGRKRGLIGPGGDKAPTGYRYNAKGDLEFIPGGPADPQTQKAKFGSREQIIFSRLATGATESVKDLENITRLPMSATTGIFGGMAGGQPTSIYEAGRNVLMNEVTPQEIQSYKTRAAGIQRSLSAIEAAGLMPPGALTHQMDAVMWVPGDTQRTKLEKLAQTRQIVEAGMEVQLSNPNVPDKERKQVEDTLERLKKTIPYTIADLDELDAAQKKNPRATLKSILQKKSREAQPPETSSAPTRTEKQPAKLLGQDQKAVDWAKKNPNDPRAQKILKLHGM